MRTFKTKQEVNSCQKRIQQAHLLVLQLPGSTPCKQRHDANRVFSASFGGGGSLASARASGDRATRASPGCSRCVERDGVQLQPVAMTRYDSGPDRTHPSGLWFTRKGPRELGLTQLLCILLVRRPSHGTKQQNRKEQTINRNHPNSEDAPKLRISG